MTDSFDTIGQAELLRHEGNRQIAAALEDGARAVLRRVAHIFAAAARRIADQN